MISTSYSVSSLIHLQCTHTGCFRHQVVQAVRGRCEVFVDGGIRRGTDVLKALALGATAVFIGRPVIWGLAHNVSYRRCFPHLSSCFGCFSSH